MSEDHIKNLQFVGIYARISVKHGANKDDSIKNQILLGRKWIQERRELGEELVETACYEDLGYSGTNFERPGFQQLLQDIREERINCVVCKDASRLGRNYLETGNYMERLFPMFNVRLVCISDGYDSRGMMPGSFHGNLRNLMNEWYTSDISRRVRMVKAQKRDNGEYLGSKPPYGYRIVKNDGKRMLAPETESMAVVEKIRKWRQEGKSLEQIRERLWEMHICPPEEYRRTGRIYEEGQEEYVSLKKWNVSMIRRILMK